MSRMLAILFLLVFQPTFADHTVDGSQPGSSGNVNKAGDDNLQKVDTCLGAQLKGGKTSSAAAEFCSKNASAMSPGGTKAIYTEDGYKNRAALLENLLVKHKQVAESDCIYNVTCTRIAPPTAGWECASVFGSLTTGAGGCYGTYASCQQACSRPNGTVH